MTPPRLFIAMLCLTLMSSGVFADMINVPADYPTIQEAIDASSDGDEIVVAPGTYTSTQDGHVVDMKGKAITLRSSDGPEVTIIDGENARRGIACVSGETDATLIEGFTITNGNATEYDYDGDGEEDNWEGSGGGILSFQSNLQLNNCKINGNTGSGIHCSESNLSINNCTVAGNQKGGGIWFRDGGHAAISECDISNNTGGLGGVYIGTQGNATIHDCNILKNTTNNVRGAGIHISGYTNVTVSGCIIEENTAIADGAGILAFGSGLNLAISQCMIDHNVGHGIFYFGFFSNKLTISDCSVSNNLNGGMFLTAPSDIDSTASIHGCVIADNSDTGIRSSANNLSISMSTIKNNVGSGIYSTGYNLTVTDSTVEANIDQSGGEAAGITATRDTSFIRCNVINNTCEGKDSWAPGGFLAFSSGQHTFIDCVISGNSSTTVGGVELLQASNASFTNSSVCSNSGKQISGNWTDNGGNTIEDECPLCPGDATGDGYVDVNDVLYVIANWDTADPNADFDEDGLVDADDVLILLSSFGESCP